MGINYPDCEAGWKHVPSYSEVLIRDESNHSLMKDDEIGLMTMTNTSSLVRIVRVQSTYLSLYISHLALTNVDEIFCVTKIALRFPSGVTDFKVLIYV